MAVMAYLRGGDPETVMAEFAWDYANSAIDRKSTRLNSSH